MDPSLPTDQEFLLLTVEGLSSVVKDVGGEGGFLHVQAEWNCQAHVLDYGDLTYRPLLSPFDVELTLALYHEEEQEIVSKPDYCFLKNKFEKSRLKGQLVDCEKQKPYKPSSVTILGSNFFSCIHLINASLLIMKSRCFLTKLGLNQTIFVRTVCFCKSIGFSDFLLVV